MRMTCHCASCGATYQVDEQFAGRKIKCPKCSAAIVVTAAAEDAEVFPAKKSASAAKPLKTAQRVGSGPAVPPLPRPPAETPPPLAPGGLDIPGLGDFSVPYSSRGHAATKSPARKKPAQGGNRGLWIGVGLGAGFLIVALGIVLVVVLMPGPKNTAAPQRPRPLTARRRSR